jgi:hypothetical protein
MSVYFLNNCTGSISTVVLDSLYSTALTKKSVSFLNNCTESTSSVVLDSFYSTALGDYVPVRNSFDYSTTGLYDYSTTGLYDYSTTGLYDYSTTGYSIWESSLILKKDILKERLKSNLIINVRSRGAPTQYSGEAEPERKALETLREIITEAEFRKYLRYGFILVKGRSGRVYQVFKNKSHCQVWLNGKVVEEICVRIKNKEIPLTDNIIAFKTIIETSEEGFKKMGNVYKMAV